MHYQEYSLATINRPGYNNICDGYLRRSGASLFQLSTSNLLPTKRKTLACIEGMWDQRISVDCQN